MIQVIEILVTLIFISFSVHKGWYFKKWSKDTKNGFHTAVLFAIVVAIVSFVLDYVAPIKIAH